MFAGPAAAFRLTSDKSPAAPNHLRAFENAEKALLNNLWLLSTETVGSKVNATIKQLQDILSKMQTKPERKVAQLGRDNCVERGGLPS